MVSIVIPSRNEFFLNKTIDDLLSKARGEIEIIVVLDGMWQEVREDPRVKVIHHGGVHDNFGLRDSVNRGMDLAQGEYVMKADGHTMWDEGFDLKLIEDCEDNWVVIPRRYRLEPESWTLVEDGRPPIDYMHIDYPFQRIGDKTCGLHGAEWKQRYRERKDILIDDTPTMQGSAYFMSKKHWKRLGDMSTELYGPFTHEAQEISQKTWFLGGRVIVNKKTHYSHLHKGKKYGTGYGFSTEQWKRWKELHEKGRLFCRDYWLYTKDYQYDWDWFINKKFPDMPGWKSTWKEDIIRDRELDAAALNYDHDQWLAGLKAPHA